MEMGRRVKNSFCNFDSNTNEKKEKSNLNYQHNFALKRVVKIYKEKQINVLART